MITVTVGITAYNEEKNIKNLLESVLRQKEDGFKMKEIIVISDGSTDNTVSTIKMISNRKIRLVDGDQRKGQNYRQNQIISLMSKESDCLLRLEADTIIKDDNYIENLTSSIPKNGLYSVIAGSTQPIYSPHLFSQIILSGFSMRREIFEKALNWPNLYLFAMALLSKEFLKSFRWDENFHEDSFCFRKALESKLPIIRNPDAVILFKIVDNLRDYLAQSGKFQKAKKKENKSSNIYKLKVSHVKALRIIIKHFLKRPVKLFLYLGLVVFSRIYSKKYSDYTPFWEIYSSSKKLITYTNK